MDGLFVLADYVVEVDHRGMGEPAMGAGLVRSVGFPAFFLFFLAPRGGNLGLGRVGEIPAPRVLSLPFALDLVVLERHLELLFPVQGSCEGVRQRRAIEPESTGDKVIGAWFVVRGV